MWTLTAEGQVVDGSQPVAKASASGEAADDAPQSAAGSHRRWSRRHLVVATLVVLTLIGVLGLVSRPTPHGSGSSSLPSVRPFMLDNLRPGQPPVSLAAYRGRPVVLNFFASWCVPCRKEMPAFERVHERLGNQVEFVGVNHQDQRDGALQLVRQTGMSYPAGYDPQGNVARDYGLFGMPTTIFISPRGQPLERHTGELSEDQLEQTIHRLLLP